MKKEQKASVTAIIFYVFAVLALAYTAFMIFTAYDYVNGYIEQGMISYGSDFKDILSLYVQQAGPYLVYSLLLYGMGYLIDIVVKMKNSMELGHEVKENTSALKTDALKAAVKKEVSKKENVKKEADKKNDTVKDTKKEDKAKAAKPKGKKTEKSSDSAKETKKEESKEKAEEK